MQIGPIRRPSPGVDPGTYAKQYAQQKGISLEEAKNELRAMYGDPKSPQAQKGKLFDKYMKT